MGIGFLTPLAISNLRIKHLHTLHDIQLLHPSGLMDYGKEEKLNSFFAKTYQFINRYLFKNCHLVISPSDWLLNEHLEKNFFNKTFHDVAREFHRALNAIMPLKAPAKAGVFGKSSAQVEPFKLAQQESPSLICWKN